MLYSRCWLKLLVTRRPNRRMSFPASSIGCLLRQAKPHLYTKPGGCAGEGVRHLWLIDGSFEISLQGQLLIDDVADIGAKLEIDISVDDVILIFDFPLNGFAVADSNIHAEGNVIFKDDGPSL